MSRSKHPLYLLAALSVLILTTSAVIVLPRFVEWRREKEAELESSYRKASCLLERYAESLHRHPDHELKRFREFLSTFQGLTPRQQASRLVELQTTFEELEDELRRLVGIDPAGSLSGNASKGAAGSVSDAEAGATAMEYKTFSPNGFKSLSDSYRYSDTTAISSPPSITGHRAADRRIIQIAERRGYVLREDTDPETLVKVEKRLLKPEAAEAYQRLKEAALKEGILLGLISGYRSILYQRRIFLNLLRIRSIEQTGREFTCGEIESGKADAIIDHILEESSIPGYSKHHTGYTLDLTDLSSGKDFTEFAHTGGFLWISADNYLNAKRFGFIPSYPEGASNQGPKPESWEYVWVGEEALRQPPPCE
jgi:LAS superfamily LD-carboxypeptidase LdcB